MVDVTDSKSVGGDTVWVRVPPPAPRQKNSAPFRFRGLRKSRENCTSAASFFLSETEVSRGTSVSVLENGSDLDCPGAPRQKDSAPFRFRGLRKSRENCTSAKSFFLFQIEPASLGFDLDTGSETDSSETPRQNKAIRSCGVTSTATSTDDLVFPFHPRLRRGAIRCAQTRKRTPRPLSRSPHADPELASFWGSRLSLSSFLPRQAKESRPRLRAALLFVIRFLLS